MLSSVQIDINGKPDGSLRYISDLTPGNLVNLHLSPTTIHHLP